MPKNSSSAKRRRQEKLQERRDRKVFRWALKEPVTAKGAIELVAKQLRFTNEILWRFEKGTLTEKDSVSFNAHAELLAGKLDKLIEERALEELKKEAFRNRKDWYSLELSILRRINPELTFEEFKSRTHGGFMKELQRLNESFYETSMEIGPKEFERRRKARLVRKDKQFEDYIGILKRKAHIEKRLVSLIKFKKPKKSNFRQ